MENLPLKYGASMLRRGFVSLAIVAALTFTALLIGTASVAWKTSLLDSYLSQPVKEFLGKVQTNSSGLSTTSDSSQPPSQNSQPTAENPTKDWKIYTNTKIGLSFKYPADWSIEEYPNGSAIFPDGFLVYVIPPGAQRADFRNVQIAYVGVLNNPAFKSNYSNLRDWVISDNPNEKAPPVVFGNKTWVETTNSKPAENGRLLYIEGNNKHIFDFLFFESSDKTFSTIVELLASSIKFL